MRMYDLIMKKRKGEELTTEEINFLLMDLLKERYQIIKHQQCLWQFSSIR